jgi:hypothetical protein
VTRADASPIPDASDHRDDYERHLLAHVERWTPMPCWSDLSQPRLAEIAHREGIDVATTLLYHCLRRSPAHGPGIAALDDAVAAGRAETGPLRWQPFAAIVPGGCHEESAASREALRLVQAEVSRQGLPNEIVPVRSFGRLPEQATAIAEWIAARREADIVVVSLSKGSAEVKLALHRFPEAFRSVTAWVNVSGLLYGSEWVRWLLDRTTSRWLARAWCWYWRYPFEAFEQLRRGPGSLLDFDVGVPAHMQTIHLIGLPLKGGLSRLYTRRSFFRLTPLGPNDGMGFMAGDVVRYAGLIYPVWGADHFLGARNLDVQDFVRRVLLYLARSHAVTAPGIDNAVPRFNPELQP